MIILVLLLAAVLAWSVFWAAAVVGARYDDRRHRLLEHRMVEWHRLAASSDQRAFLRHPMHRPRCSCGRYGLPFMERVVADDGDHTLPACFPRTESLEG